MVKKAKCGFLNIFFFANMLMLVMADMPILLIFPHVKG